MQGNIIKEIFDLKEFDEIITTYTRIFSIQNMKNDKDAISKLILFLNTIII